MEKIKTIGSTYMAAAGLTNPVTAEERQVRRFDQSEQMCIKRTIHHRSDVSQASESSYNHIRSMLDFAVALMGSLKNINTHSFNNFKLRIGTAHIHTTHLTNLCFPAALSELIEFPLVFHTKMKCFGVISLV